MQNLIKMIRIIKISDKYYGLEVDITTDEEIANIEQFVNEGNPVIIVNDLDELEFIYDLDKDDVEMVS